MTKIITKKDLPVRGAIQTPDGAGDPTPTAKVFALIELLAQRGSARLTDLAAVLGVPKTTLHRVTSQLEQLGYLQREPGGRQITIAPRLTRLSADILEASLKLAPRHSILEQLAHEVGESCSLGIRVGYEVVYLDDIAGSSPLSYNFQMGCRSPLYCTSTGKLYLAWMSNSELDRYLKSEKLIPYTENTITDADSLRKVISTIREDGFASTNSEFVLGVIGAAVPVVDKTNRLLAGLAISVPSVRMAFADIPKLRPALAEAADALVHTFD